jgi:cytidylate kinase
MVGRDIATVVTPEAGVKIYLDASVEERGRRRAAELRARGVTISDEAVIADLAERDRFDSSRALSPLMAAPDATRVNTDGLSISEVVDQLEQIVRDSWARMGLSPERIA